MPAVNQFGHPVTQDRSYRAGRIISRIFHPIFNGIASFVLVGLRAPGLRSPLYGLLWAAVCILTLITPSTIYFYVRLGRGDFSDDDVSRRTERYGLYIVALLSTVVGSFLLYLLGVPTIFLRLILAAIGVTAVASLTNLVWKISVHSTSIATLATLATLLFQRFGAIVWVCALLVGWARVRTGNHTILQVLAGWGVAVAGVLLAFRLGT